MYLSEKAQPFEPAKRELATLFEAMMGMTQEAIDDAERNLDREESLPPLYDERPGSADRPPGSATVGYASRSGD